MGRLYGYPDIGRFGLGHSLLAWARCEVWCRNNGGRMIGPRWFRPRLGPYLRRERDKREYFKLFTNQGYLGEPWRTALLATARKVPSEESGLASEKDGNTVVVFRNAVASNFEKHFHEVRGHGLLLHAAIRNITRERYLPKASSAFLAVHVRLGDFSQFNATRVDAGIHNQRLPIEWYRDSLSALREALGGNVPARIFSDGDDASLQPLLSLPGVQRANDAESITHMLEMAQASAIIGAGSGFNLWAAFFGQVPRISYPNQSIVAVNDNPDSESSFQSDRPMPGAFVQQVRRRLSRH